MSIKIKKIFANQIFDSRGTPTVEAYVVLESGVIASASVPSGASTGQYEACELRDGEEPFSGKGVLRACTNVNTVIADLLVGKKADDLYLLDHIMINEDGSANKSNLGANAILAVSLACAKASALHYKLPLYKYLGGTNANTMPVPMMNIINGGAHAENNLDIQEFMIIPSNFTSFTLAMQASVEVYHNLKKLLHEEHLSVSVGDEGGFAPDLKNEEHALELICKAIEITGYTPGVDMFIALDVASSEWATGTNYIMPKKGQTHDSDSLSRIYYNLTSKYPIVSIEDPFSENDWSSFTKFTKDNPNIQIVGDDLFVTNIERLKIGIIEKAANAILIKPNQIGSLSETLDVIKHAQQNGYKTIISHRSGETTDTYIADIAVATNAGQIKAGAPARGERVAKYNRLIRIEHSLYGKGLYGN